VPALEFAHDQLAIAIDVRADLQHRRFTVASCQTFAIGWKGRYCLEGPAFVYSDQDTGRVAAILGYPTDKLSQIG
jgi:hypothetical protein